MDRYTHIFSILSEYFQGHPDICETILKQVKLIENNYIYVTDQLNYLSNEYHYLTNHSINWPYKNDSLFGTTPFYKYILQKNRYKRETKKKFSDYSKKNIEEWLTGPDRQSIINNYNNYNNYNHYYS